MKISKVDFLYKEGYVLPEFKIESLGWHKIKLVHYHDGINYRFRGTIDGIVLLDLKELGQNKFNYMKLMSNSTTQIGNLQNIRIAGK